jgi:hypothetical protein
MTKIKTLGTAVLLIATVAAPVFAQDKGDPESRHGLEPTNSAESERPRPDFGMRNSEKTEPGDFAVTDGLSGRGQDGGLDRPSRSRHKQQPGWERRRRVTARGTLNNRPRRCQRPSIGQSSWIIFFQLFCSGPDSLVQMAGSLDRYQQEVR